MKIVGISTVKDEPWLHETLDHMVRQGVDEFHISYDGDLPAVDAHLVPCDTPFDQGQEMTRLAKHVTTDWIIPFDADEFWVGTGGTIRQVLEQVPAHITHIYAAMYLHLDKDRKVAQQKPLGKVAMRPADDLIIHWGSHHCNRAGEAAHGLLQVREIQYRDWDHYRAKVEKARQLHTQPHMAGSPHGYHMESLIHLSETELWERWQAHLAQPTVEDPI